MTDPDTAGTDPLTAVIAEALADQFLCRTIPRHRDKPEHLCRTCKEDKARMTAAVVAAVRAHLDATTQKAAAQALRDAADALLLPEDNWPEAPHNCRTHDLDVADWLRNRADTLELS